jgi:long-chain acyl-CoA synthetase
MKPTRLFDIPYRQLEKFPKDDAFTMKIGGVWTKTSTQEFINKSQQLAKGLIALGVQPGDRVGLISPNRLEWNLVDIAIQQAGAIVVPIYPTISASDYEFIFTDAHIKVCFISGQDLCERVGPLREKLSFLEHLYSFDEISFCENWSKVLNMASDEQNDELKNRMDAVKPEDLVSLIYTSGTTGNPKGVMLTHNNIMSNVLACEPRIPASFDTRALTFLPACHIYERMLQYLYMYIGTSIYYAESLETIGDNIREVKPHIFTAVPRLLEKVFDKIMAKGEELTGIKKKLFFWAVGLAEQYELEGKSGWYLFQLKLANKVIFSKWREALGGNVQAIASGSAALQARLARIFMAAQIPVMEGYGLTETSPVVSVNAEKQGVCFGSVGTVLDGVEVKIAEDGEILVKGPNVMIGYYNNPTATAEVMDADGWFHTGDIGEFVQGKFLKITDRKKEMFKTSGGKYVAPQVMENRFKASRFIEQIIVIGDNRKHPAALIVPSYDYVREWAKSKEITLGQTNTEIINNQKVIDRIQKEVDTFNAEFGKFEQIKKIKLLPAEFSIEGGELTPTLKLKRKVIMAKYDALVEEIYKEG